MKIINETKQVTLAENVIEPTSLRDQTMGLLAYPTPVALILKSRFGIHTLFMKYPIDVLILDKNGLVKTMKEHMLPNNIFVWNPLYYVIIELPDKTIITTKTQVGDKLIIT